MKELEIKSIKEILESGYIEFKPNRITNDDNNLYIFRHIIDSIEKNENGVEMINMNSDIKTIVALKDDPIQYYIEKRSWDYLIGITNKEIIHITLIEKDKYIKYTK